MKLQLTRPVPGMITQRYGENNICVREDDGTIVGKKDGVCPIGSIEFYPSIGLKYHNGDDFSTYRGESVRAAHEGIVNIFPNNGTAGNMVKIISENQYEITSTVPIKAMTLYMHNLSFVATQGQRVRAGDVISLSDSTGASSADHLHFGLYECKDNGIILNQDNGVKGAIDPELFFPRPSELQPDWRASVIFGILSLMGIKLTDEVKRKIIRLLNP